MGEVVDGKNENEVGEKRIRERIARVRIHVGLRWSKGHHGRWNPHLYRRMFS